jgi:extracellular factor (EF) 3-hydroxypalmitic acid methyl ester biosynthesis protein
MVHTLPEMGNKFNGDINGNGTHNPVFRSPKKVTRATVAASFQVIKESLVTFSTADGVKLQGIPVRITRHIAVFELYNPNVTPRFSEALDEFEIIMRAQTVYSGRATVRNVLDIGLNIICEVTLNENFWRDVNFTDEMLKNGALRNAYSGFMREWQKLYKILPEYKIIVADMQSFLTDLRLWLEQVNLGMLTSQPNDRAQLEQDVVTELAKPVLPCLDELFQKFEIIVKNLDEDLHPSHQNYMRRQLHPLVLNAPFAQRSFQKPLGYAGDYEMVNMIVRNTHEGGSLFAKIINAWFLSQPPSQAHRNRIDYLEQLLFQESIRVIAAGQFPRILDLACGPAQEIQKFLIDHPISGKAKITLLDFNKETLEYLRTTLDEIKARYVRETSLHFVKKSVFQLIKESGKETAVENQYDVIFCAGLFDYLSDQVCKQLMDIMYKWLVPGGLLVVTNVESSNPLRNGMDHLLDWHLNYRTSHQLKRLTPTEANTEEAVVRADATGVNIFLEIRKPDYE